MKISHPFYLLILCLIGCSEKNPQVNHLPPISHDTTLGPSYLLNYLANSDQKGRVAVGLNDLVLLWNSKDTQSELLDLIDSRDPDRLPITKRAFSGTEKPSDMDKYNLALVFIHSGSSKIAEDSTYHRKAAELFEGVAKDATDSLLVRESRRMAKAARLFLKKDSLSHSGDKASFRIEEKEKSNHK